MQESSESEGLYTQYRYRLRVTPTQARQLQTVFDLNRFLWNQTLGRWNDLWRYERETYGEWDMYREWRDWRQTFDWLAAGPIVPQGIVIRNLAAALRGFYAGTYRRPRFKKKGSVTSASWDRNGFSLRGGRLSVSVIGGMGKGHFGRTLLRVVWSRPLPSVPSRVTITRDHVGHWYAVFFVRLQPETLPASGVDTGLDLGVKTFATTEFPDADIENPRFRRHALADVKTAQRAMARKVPGSKGYAKARKRTARIHAKIANQRRDFHQKEARKLARRFDRIGVERLRIENMRHRGHGRNKTGLREAISDAGWGGFVTALDWQARKVGREIVRFDAANTTQNCSGCGTKAKVHVGIKQRTFRCSECGLVIDRDRNAAHNLHPGWAVPGVPVDGNKTPRRKHSSAARGAESPSSQESSQEVFQCAESLSATVAPT